MKILVLLLSCLPYLSFAQTDHVIVLGAPHNEKSYYSAFDRNVINYYRTFSSLGLKRDQITILNGNGQNSFQNTKVKDHAALVKGIHQDNRKVEGNAKKATLKKKFQELAKTLKAGDHFSLFITGHGSLKNGKTYIQLWGEETLTVGELKEYLKLLPSGVIKHISGNTCFSGELVALTNEPNTCVITSVDNRSFMKAYHDNDPYSDLLMSRIGAGISMYDSHNYAQITNKMNKSGQNSLDWFLAVNPPGGKYLCDTAEESTFDSLSRSVLSMIVTDKSANTDYMKAWRKNKAAIEKAAGDFDKLSATEQNKRRGEFTKLIDEMKENLQLLSKDQPPSYYRTMDREKEFIEKASATQLKKYLEIKKCMNYAYKK